MKVGTGSSQATDGWTAGREIARSAMEQGCIQAPSLALAFCSLAVDAAALLEGIRAEIGAQTPVVGGSGLGIITNTTICYQGSISGLLLIEAPEMEIRLASVGGLDQGEHQVGCILGRQLPLAPATATLLFYDSIRVGPTATSPPVMNSSRSLLAGLQAQFARPYPVVGAGVMGDEKLSPTIQFIGDRVATQSAVTLSLTGDFAVDWCIMHGCTLKDGLYYTITRREGPVIHELDGRPIVEVIDEMYGDRSWQTQVPLKRLTIGVNHGERYARAFREEDYVNRLILGVLPDRSGILTFESDLEVGTEIQFMLRDSHKILESARMNAEHLLRRVRAAGREPLLGLYIDCAGRNAQFSESLQEESAEVQDIFNQADVPLFGFFSGVEIAPFESGSRSLDWTGVLMVFTV
ncbi:FIST signal transduction protein [Thiocystis violacea]|uniref:FIST signal transduction protein n=1 Tax=Thiocystis violacea TaxID=13725 RepID=UPI0019030943|nr:FIST N-terminal domain-containing protein [Thiocystis violacea]MBK1723559.1 hypothetical protein [Thiocystis violacea]